MPNLQKILRVNPQNDTEPNRIKYFNFKKMIGIF